MLFVTMQEDAARLWIPLDKVCLVEEETKGYNNRQIRIFLQDQVDPVELDNEDEITSFFNALTQVHGGQVIGN